MARKITVNPFDPKSIESAKRQLNEYKRTVEQMLGSLIQTLTQEGAEFARAEVISMDAVMTGELADSITGVYNSSTRTGVISAGADHAIYVEFGTGIVGANTPHPESNGNYADYGWWYWNDYSNNWVFTYGMESRPFMYNTWEFLTERVAQK